MDNIVLQRQREILTLQDSLLSAGIPSVYLQKCAKILNQSHMEQIHEERSVAGKCGEPSCFHSLSK